MAHSPQQLLRDWCVKKCATLNITLAIHDAESLREAVDAIPVVYTMTFQSPFLREYQNDLELDELVMWPKIPSHLSTLGLVIEEIPGGVKASFWFM